MKRSLNRYDVKTRNQGSILISFVFVIFLAFAGISLVSFTVMHTMIVRARTTKIMETDKMYQNLIFYLHHFREKIFNERIQDFIKPEVDYFNAAHFPAATINNEHSLSLSFNYFEVPKTGYMKTRVIAALDISSVSPSRNSYDLVSRVFIDILSGKIPLTFFPFFLDIGDGGEVPPDVPAFLKAKNIINKSQKKPLVDKLDVETGVTDFLLHALKISGSHLDWPAVREKFGFPPSNDPIPAGIYFLSAEGVVESIFIQGDIERMIFSTADHLQEIRLIKNTVSYDLRYKPGENDFECWDFSIARDSLFMEKIIVNGSVWSIEQDSDGAFDPTSNLQLLVGGKAVIRSNLETASSQLDVRKTTFSNFKLTCGKEFLEGVFGLGGPDSEVVVDTDQTTNLHASIIADGKFTNKSKDLKLSGSLYCKDLENAGSIEIDHRSSPDNGDNYSCTVDFKYIEQFIIHFIEEVYDGNDKE